MFAIETDVPLPANRGRSTVHRFPFGEMQVGQSFALPTDKLRNAAARSANAFSKHNPGYKFVTRAVGDGSFRLWRIAA
jgi:hypothetical protein